MTVTRRTANRRGQGSQLRDEILQAASRLLISSSGDAVTLRAIAREAGIAAPSIYPHFADRDAIIGALVTRGFEQLSALGAEVFAKVPPGAAQVRAVAAGYVGFATEQPSAYRIIFEHKATVLREGTTDFPAGRDAFEYVVRAIAGAVAQGESSSTDPERDAQALWSALHGIVTIVPATPDFPWRPTSELIDRLVTALAALEGPAHEA